MRIVAAEVSIEEGSIEPVRDALRMMEIESLKEPGCQTYAFSLDISGPDMDVKVYEVARQLSLPA